MEGADLFGGKYTTDEVKSILEINARPNSLLKPMNPFYKKNSSEHGPSWEERREVSP